MAQFLTCVRLVLGRALENWWVWVRSNIIEASVPPILAAAAGYYLSPRLRQSLPVLQAGDGGDMNSVLVGFIWAIVAGAATFLWFLFSAPYKIYREQQEEIERLSKSLEGKDDELVAERQAGKPKLSASIAHLSRILNSSAAPLVAMRVELSNERSQSIAKHWELEAIVEGKSHKAKMVQVGRSLGYGVCVDDFCLFSVSQAESLDRIALDKPLKAGSMVAGILIFEFPSLSSESLASIPFSDLHLSFADITGARFKATNNPAVAQNIRSSADGPVADSGNFPVMPPKEGVEESGPRLGGAAAL